VEQLCAFNDTMVIRARSIVSPPWLPFTGRLRVFSSKCCIASEQQSGTLVLFFSFSSQTNKRTLRSDRGRNHRNFPPEGLKSLILPLQMNQTQESKLEGLCTSKRCCFLFQTCLQMVVIFPVEISSCHLHCRRVGHCVLLLSLLCPSGDEELHHHRTSSSEKASWIETETVMSAQGNPILDPQHQGFASFQSWLFPNGICRAPASWQSDVGLIHETTDWGCFLPWCKLQH